MSEQLSHGLLDKLPVEYLHNHPFCFWHLPQSKLSILVEIICVLESAEKFDTSRKE